MNEAEQDPGPAAQVQEGLAAMRGHGESADGRVQVDLDGTGDLVELSLDPRVMRIASSDLADATKTAFGHARQDVQRQLDATRLLFDVTGGQVAAELDHLRSTAERRLLEMMTLAESLDARLGRMS